MALFTDAEFITQADLISVDPEVPKVANAIGMAVESGAQNGAGNICALAIDEFGQKLILDSQSVQGSLTPWAVPYNQSAAILNATLPAVNRSRIYLTQIVVSGPSPGYSTPMKTFATSYALWWLFRAAYRRFAGSGKDGDRYKVKKEEYEKEWKYTYYPRVMHYGMPVVSRPLPCPGAIHEVNAGTFGTSNVSTVAGTNANASTTYDVAITWVDTAQGYLSATSKGFGESGPSARVQQTVASANVIRTSLAGLTSPAGASPLSQQLGQGLFLYGSATGWNVYVGTPGGTLYLQNATPIPIATTTYTLAGAPVLSGNQADQGQPANQVYTMQRTLDRG